MIFRIKLLHEKAKIPERMWKSAGYDVFAVEDMLIHPMQTKVVKLGFAAEFDPEYVAYLWPRSGMSVLGAQRTAGVIDADYREEWGIVLTNIAIADIVIKPGNRVGQIVFHRIEHPMIETCTELVMPSDRGSGFGSSGR